MFKRLLQTTNDPLFTIIRLVLGLVFFAHGAQKMLGWFGGYGFSGTLSAFSAFGMPKGFEYHLLAIGLAVSWFSVKWKIGAVSLATRSNSIG